MSKTWASAHVQTKMMLQNNTACTQAEAQLHHDLALDFVCSSPPVKHQDRALEDAAVLQSHCDGFPVVVAATATGLAAATSSAITAACCAAVIIACEFSCWEGISNHMGIGQYAAIGTVNEACPAMILRDWQTVLSHSDVDYSWRCLGSCICNEVGS